MPLAMCGGRARRARGEREIVSRVVLAEKGDRVMPSSEESMLRVSPLRFWGALAVAFWFATFATGTLVPSCPYRRLLDPSLSPECKPVAEKPGDGAAARRDFVDGSLQIVDVVAAVPPPTSPLFDVSTIERSWGLLAAALLTGAVSYSPCNLALLALAAGLIGGCASRLTWGDLENTRADAAEATAAAAEKSGKAKRAAAVGAEPEPPVSALDTRLRYLQENPIASMCRGLVSYLFVLAGLLAFTPAPFESTTPDSYLRMAGLVSAVAFAVGYDPSRLSAFLNRLPVKVS
jgi:hypothetical protein